MIRETGSIPEMTLSEARELHAIWRREAARRLRAALDAAEASDAYPDRSRVADITEIVQ